MSSTVKHKLNQNPSPGNIAGGLLNITIKSLGAISKAGTTRIEGVTEYAETPSNRGVNLMLGPGYDQESTPGLVAAGATIVVFTTGRGTTIGNAIAPVIKLASNTPVFERMSHDLDLSAGRIIDGTETIDEVGERLLYVASPAARSRQRLKSTNIANFSFGPSRLFLYNNPISSAWLESCVVKFRRLEPGSERRNSDEQVHHHRPNHRDRIDSGCPRRILRHSYASR